MELLRLVAMLSVILFHLDFLGMGIELHVIEASPLSTILGAVGLKSLTMSCVNLFVLVSGWYGIRFTLHKLGTLVFQVLFYSLPIYLVFVFIGRTPFSVNYFLHLLLTNGYWFVGAYLILFILSPLLNRFTENTTAKEQRILLFALFGLMFLYGWISDDKWFDRGCSPLFFICLYLLARYFSIHRPTFTLHKPKFYFLFYAAVMLPVVLLGYVLVASGRESWLDKLYQYNSPVNILCSVLLLLAFSRLRFHYKIVNWMGRSCFAVYLLHAHPDFYQQVFYPIVRQLFMTASGFQLLFHTVVLVTVLYLMPILIDQLRIRMWGLFSRLFLGK